VEEKKTYYMILGVSNSETPSGIRAAFRDRARVLHPDIAGERATRSFQELNEAYEVLSDPSRRHAYNAELSLAAGPRRVTRVPVSILDQPDTVHPSFAEVRDRFLRNFTGLRIPKAERIEPLEVEVLLTPEGAAAGCHVPIGVPLFEHCPRCDGSGRQWSYPCGYCRQSGMLETERVVRVRVPPMTPSGVVYEGYLGGLGIHNFQLRLHVFVER
jgi:molecular chaperone DnaJ